MQDDFYISCVTGKGFIGGGAVNADFVCVGPEGFIVAVPGDAVGLSGFFVIALGLLIKYRLRKLLNDDVFDKTEWITQLFSF
jgi:hypothetical protein